MRLGVAQRPQLARGGQDQVDRVHGQVVGGPLRGGGDRGADVATVVVDVLGDQGEAPLGVGVAGDQPAVVAEPGLEGRKVLDDAVVRDQPALLLEQTSVAGSSPPVEAYRMCAGNVVDSRSLASCTNCWS